MNEGVCGDGQDRVNSQRKPGNNGGTGRIGGPQDTERGPLGQGNALQDGEHRRM